MYGKYRKALGEAKGRKFTRVVLWIVAMSIAFFMGVCTGYIYEYAEGIQTWLKGMGTFIAVISVTSYNLRNRNIDYMLREAEYAKDLDKWMKKAEATGVRLTNIVLLSFCTSLWIFLNAIIPTNCMFGLMFVLSCGGFAVCLVEYLYVLMAFEGLERFMINQEKNQIQEKRKQEAQKMLKETNISLKKMHSSKTNQTTE